MGEPGYILRATSHEEHTTLPFEDALELSRELAVTLDDKVAIFRASDDKKLAVSGVGVTPRDVGMGVAKEWKMKPRKGKKGRRR